MKENEILREIMRDAKIGWWQADRNRRVFHISEGLRDLLGVASCDVTYEEFGKMITPAYREYALASIGVRGGAERLYPLQGPEGEIWCYWKLLREEVAEDGGMLLTGYFRVVDPPSEVVRSEEKQRINDLLFRLNSISQTLLSLLKVDDLDAVVDEILADVLTMFDGGRAYIIESDPEHRLYNCTYEVTAENVTGEQELVSGISMDEVPWWTQRIANGQPVIISSLDELPDEAFREREVLAMQDIKSLIAVPLLSRDKVWGYAGIDIVNRPRRWTGSVSNCSAPSARRSPNASTSRASITTCPWGMPSCGSSVTSRGNPSTCWCWMPTTPPTRSWGLRAKPISAGVSPNWDWIWSNI